MKNINVGVVGFTNNFKKFLTYLDDKNSIYNLKFLIKNDSKDVERSLIKYCLNTKIKFLIICDDKFRDLVTKNIEFLIKRKIITVKAATNYEIENHGFIIQKLFKDFSFEDIFLRKKLKINERKANLNFRNKKILITGGGGSIGSNLIINLLKYKVKKIFVIDNNEYALFKLLSSISKLLKKKIKVKIMGIENKKMVDNFVNLSKPDIIFHTAALKHVKYLEENPVQGILTNIVGTKNIIEASNKYNVKKFIHVSTDKAARPKNNLGITKKLSENICFNFSKSKLRVGIVRFRNVFDSNGSVSEIFRKKILKQQKISITNSKVKRFFMSNDEASNLLFHVSNELHVKNNSKKVRVFIYNMGEPIQILELAKKMAFLSGRPIAKFINKKYSGLNKVEKIVEQLMNKNEYIKNIDQNNILEIAENKTISKYLNFKKILKIINQDNDRTANKYLKKIAITFNK